MSGTLDDFLPASIVKPKPSQVYVEERCVKCGAKIPFNEPKYTLRLKGKEGVYCQNCAKKILHPHENTDENL